MTRWVAGPMLALLALLVFVPGAEAGWRELELVATNMTPDPSDASRECSARFRRALRRDDTRLRMRGETALRQALGQPAGTFREWPTASFAPLRRAGDVDAVVLFDCRPEMQRFEALVVATGGRTTVSLRARPLDAARVRMLAERIREAGYLGFSP